MAAGDWLQCSAVEIAGRGVSGTWVMKHWRALISVVFEDLADCMTIDEMMEHFPVTRALVGAAIKVPARILNAPVHGL